MPIVSNTQGFSWGGAQSKLDGVLQPSLTLPAFEGFFPTGLSCRKTFPFQ
jgi:hypothetical protein